MSRLPWAEKVPELGGGFNLVILPVTGNKSLLMWELHMFEILFSILAKLHYNSTIILNICALRDFVILFSSCTDIEYLQNLRLSSGNM